MLFGKRRANYLVRGQEEQAEGGCLKGRPPWERNRMMLCKGIPTPTFPMQKQLYFTVSGFLSSANTNLEHSKKVNTRNHVISGADKEVSEPHPLLKRKKKQNTKPSTKPQ